MTKDEQTAIAYQYPQVRGFGICCGANIWECFYNGDLLTQKKKTLAKLDVMIKYMDVPLAIVILNSEQKKYFGQELLDRGFKCVQEDLYNYARYLSTYIFENPKKVKESVKYREEQAKLRATWSKG